METGVICKILAPFKEGAQRFPPGAYMDVPEHRVPELTAEGKVEPIESPMLTNVPRTEDIYVLRRRKER